MARNTFGMDPEKMTDDELKAELKVHNTTILEGKVGTPNVYVRKGTLEREIERRKGKGKRNFTVYGKAHLNVSVTADSEEEATPLGYEKLKEALDSIDDGTVQWTELRCDPAVEE